MRANIGARAQSGLSDRGAVRRTDERTDKQTDGQADVRTEAQIEIFTLGWIGFLIWPKFGRPCFARATGKRTEKEKKSKKKNEPTEDETMAPAGRDGQRLRERARH